MGFRFRKRVKLIPGVWINLSKKGGSLSVGGHGATVNLSKRGVIGTAGLPGSGISYRASPVLLGHSRKVTDHHERHRGAICRPAGARRSDTLRSILNGLLQLTALGAGLLALAWIATHWH
jgi:Protein of unknown function (DUF4236)